ncbi:hypothetical protein PYW07_000740 [Mythimna separata]|uniref:Uncharacterized protein n=1 Tax=Mythimna separata TaxID=271217 RepID=A0AAD8DW40_MYTSE|nr:hypothetical protein PYW07_000740 [Mythimna separata]
MEPQIPCLAPVDDYETSTGTFSPADQAIKLKAASAPVNFMVIPETPSEEVVIKPQLSAPSYLNSLRENDEPPFRKPPKEPRPCIITRTIMNEAEAVAMIAALETDGEQGLRKFLGDFVVQKKIIANYFLSEKNFLISLLTETIDYAAQREFDALKLSTLITIYLATHKYFKWYYWQSPTAVWTYFKDLMIRHTIDDTPDGEEIFAPEECYDILSHFHTVYLSNLPLVHIVTFGTYRIKLMWPFKMRVQNM